VAVTSDKASVHWYDKASYFLLMRFVIYIRNLVDEQYTMDYAMLPCIFFNYLAITLEYKRIIDAFNDKNENVWFVKTNENWVIFYTLFIRRHKGQIIT